jgi:hypothetical protein
MDKKTRQQLRKIILEEVSSMSRPRKRSLSSYVFEDADPAKIDPARFPTKLSDVPAKAQYTVTTGPEDGEPSDDDKVAVKEGTSFKCQELKPSQTSMNIEKAMGMALGMMKSGKPGGDLGAFISSDKYIMDGHHRWISTAMVDPSAPIIGNLVNLPGKELVGVLNALTAGKFGHDGKPASGGFDQFKEAPIKAQLEKNMKEGVGGDFPIPAEEVATLVKNFGGDVDGCVKKFVKNLSTITMSTPSWAPERPDMPVIEKGDSAAAKKALTGGEIDLNPPYADEKEISDKGSSNESRRRRNDNEYMMERWQKMAGLIKG